MVRTTRVVSWNANGLLSRRPELLQFLADYDVDVALIQETHFRPATNFTVPNYAIYRTDRADQAHRPCGGTAVLVHRRVPHRHVDLSTMSLESTTVAVPFAGAELRLTSAYGRPQRPLNESDFDLLLPPGAQSLVGGDFNSKHSDWGCRTTNHNGRCLRRILHGRPHADVAYPDSPTHYSWTYDHAPDILDFFIHSGVAAEISVSAVTDLSSDHVPVVCELEDLEAQLCPPVVRPRVNWAKYYNFLADRPRPPPTPAADPAQLDRQVDELTAALQEAVQAALLPRAPASDLRRSLPGHLKAEVAERRRLRREWQRSRCPQTKAQFNRQSRRVAGLLRDHSEGLWRDFLASQSMEDGSVWRLAKSLRREKRTIRPLHGLNGLVYSPEEKAEAFADSLEGQFSPHHDVCDDRHADHVESFLDSVDPDDTEEDDPLPPVTDHEVMSILARLKLRKAPGPDTLGSPALRRLPPWVISLLTSIFNSCFRLCHFPLSWKAAKVIHIPKPRKDPLFPQNHRPISLLPTLSKVLERLILARFPEEFHLSISSEQFGFRRGHSTTLQLARVLNDTALSIEWKRVTTAVLIDVSKAFDKVWHEGLLYKLAHSPLPKTLFTFLRSYLRDRCYYVSVGQAASSVRRITAGVPQGSVLGPILYLWYTNDMPVVPNVKLSLYADDAMFRATSTQARQSVVYLQRQMDALEPWLLKWRVKVNASKCEAICFTRRVGWRARCEDVTLHGAPIPWKAAVKYLGVTLDKKLTMTPHVNQRCRLTMGATACLAPLLRRESSLSLSTRVRLYTALLRPVLTYAAPAWYHLASETAQKRLQVQQNKFLRRATGSPWFVRNSTISASAGVTTIESFVAALTAKMIDRAEASEWPHLRDIAAEPLVQLRSRRAADHDPP